MDIFYRAIILPTTGSNIRTIKDFPLYVFSQDSRPASKFVLNIRAS